MSLSRSMEIAASGLAAQRARMEIVGSNLANMQSTRTSEGGPYRRRHPVFVAEPLADAGGHPLVRALRTVRLERIAEDAAPPLMRFEPGHPDADAEGMVAYPNINRISEMVDMLSATRSYEANVTLIRSVKEMSQSALQIVA